MRIGTYLILAAICFSTSAGAQSDQIERQVLDSHKAWFEAFDRGDVEAIDRMETDDFVLVNGDRIVDKQQQLENIRTGFGGGAEMTRVVGLHSFSLMGDAAVITGVQYSSSQAGGDSIVFTEVWMRGDAGWKVTLAHFSPGGLSQ